MQNPPGSAPSCRERWDSPVPHEHMRNSSLCSVLAPAGTVGTQRGHWPALALDKSIPAGIPLPGARARRRSIAPHREMFDPVALENLGTVSGGACAFQDTRQQHQERLWGQTQPQERILEQTQPQERIWGQTQNQERNWGQTQANPASWETRGSLISAPPQHLAAASRAKGVTGRECGASRPKSTSHIPKSKPHCSTQW